MGEEAGVVILRVVGEVNIIASPILISSSFIIVIAVVLVVLVLVVLEEVVEVVAEEVVESMEMEILDQLHKLSPIISLCFSLPFLKTLIITL